jgi:N utilization substance protein A
LREIASIGGLDEQTAEELQNRAREYLDRLAAQQDAKRKELGVMDELREVEGVTPTMLVAFGEAGIKSVEDLAGCATDDLIGWTERKPGETIKHKGALSDLELSTEEVNGMIMAARVKAGWIEATAAAPEAPVEDAAAEAQA